MSHISEEQVRFDQQHIWHPYSSMINPPTAFPVEAADGVRLKLSDGRLLIDGMASWWSVIHGYNHPELNAAAHQQIDTFSHVMFGGLTHKPAIELSEQLIKLTPAGLEKVFLADSGSISVEVALKMAIQYWHAKGQQQKHRFITVKNGYHGDTFGAMSVCDPVTGMHEIFSGILPQHFFAPAPPAGFNRNFTTEDIAELEQLMADNHQQIAALILEPIVQGAGGMRFYSPEYLAAAAQLCKKYQILLIADEIATGFGRTGRMFACEHANISPDILCVGKSLTGGYVTLAATLTTKDIAETISSGGAGCFMHGPTFMGNPLACAIANASLKLLQTGDWQTEVSRIEQALTIGLAPAKQSDYVADVRVLGAIGVIELKEPVDTKKIQPMFVDQGIWVRPFGKLVYVMPPYVMNNEDIAVLTAGMAQVIERYHKS